MNMDQQNENKNGGDQLNEKHQQNKKVENYKNLDDVGKNNPIFNIIRGGEKPIEVKADSRINLAISLSKFRINYLFYFDKIDLQGNIYRKDYFQFFLDLACAKDDELEKSENFRKYSPYLYVYSDIWGFNELKHKIDKLWQDNPEYFKLNENEENEENNGNSEKSQKDINKTFTEDLISFIYKIKPSSNKSELTDINPTKYFAENINTILKNAQTYQFMNISPRILNTIIQSIPKEKLDGKIYFDFLMEYINKAYENNKKLFLYEPLISYIDFDALEYDNIKKFILLNYSKTKPVKSEVSTSSTENYNKSSTKDEKVEKKDGGKATEEDEEEEEFEEKREEEEEEFEVEEGSEYFDFITFTQFRSFARKLINENEKNKKELENLNKSFKELEAKFEENKQNLEKCFEENQSKLSKSTDERAKDIEDVLDSNKRQITELTLKNKDLDDILVSVNTNSSNYNAILANLQSIKNDFNSLKYNYNISSYIISAINRQFIPINRNEDSILKIYKDIDGIKCQADLNYQNDESTINFEFFSIKDKNNNPIIYFHPNYKRKNKHKQNENINEQSVNDYTFIDFIVREYEIEVENRDFQKLLSWEIEGYFPKDFNNYTEYKNQITNIPDDQWFPISIHSAADAIIYNDKFKLNQQFDTLFTDTKFKSYKSYMGYSPICKCIRFKMIRNSSDTNIMKISRFQFAGQVLQPFYPQIKS